MRELKNSYSLSVVVAHSSKTFASPPMRRLQKGWVVSKIKKQKYSMNLDIPLAFDVNVSNGQ